MTIDYLRNKKVAVLGLSVEGLATAKFLLDKGVPLTLLDKKELSELDKEAIKFSSHRAINLRVGEGYLERLDEYEVVFRTPGFPLWHPILQEAKEKGALITSQTKLFFDLCPCPIIGVTGTKGKGTTATLIYEILKAAGRDAYLGGNIGQPPLAFWEKLTPDSLVVLELSSFQLEDLTVSPHLAVVLMVTSEHLASAAPDSPNYHRSLAEYLTAKRNIVLFQKKTDLAVVNADFENSRKLVSGVKSRVFYFSTKNDCYSNAFLAGENLVIERGQGREIICQRAEVFLRGDHNLQNILAAAAASLLIGVPMDKVREVAKTFRGLEHRLEFVAEAAGVKYYDDSFSTTPETATAAMAAFNEPLVVILGGSEKNSDYTELGRTISRAKNLKAVILIGRMAERIKQAVVAAGGFPRGCAVVEGLRSMKEIVERARNITSSGDAVLLSPACASFDMFKSYKERGEQFKREVTLLSNPKGLRQTLRV